MGLTDDKWNKAGKSREAKSCTTGGLTDIERRIVQSQNGVIGYRGVSFDVYKKSAVVGIASSLIARMVADIPKALKDKNGNRIDDDEIANIVLNNPNETDDGREFMERLAMWYILHGNAFALVTGTPRRPGSMIPLYSNHIWIEPNSYISPQWVEYYRDLVTGQTYQREEIVHIKTIQLEDRTKGISWLTASYQELMRSENAGTYAQNIITQGTWPSQVLTSDMDLTPDQVSDISESIRKKYAGQDNAGTPLILSGGMKPYPLVFSPKDMEILQEEKHTIAMILAAFMVPSILVGDIQESKNAHTYEQAIKQFINQCVIPLTNRILGKFNRFFYPDGKRMFMVEVDAVDALKPNVADLAAAYWMTPNQKRAKQGLQTDTTVAELDQYFIPSGMVPIQEAGMGNAGEM